MRKIDAVVLERNLDNYIAAGGSGGEAFRKMIRQAPTVEETGEWVEYPSQPIWHTTCCEARYDRRSKYCPNCGARMKYDAVD